MGAIVVGDPDGSEMIRRIHSEDPDEVMPPPETKKTLTRSAENAIGRVDPCRCRIPACTGR